MDFQRNQTFSQYLISKNISVEFILEQIDILEKLVEDEPHFSFYWNGVLIISPTIYLRIYEIMY